MTKPIERRIVDAPFQVRENADGTVGVRGYASVFDHEEHGEVIRSSAFNRTVAQRDDVRLLVNHDGVPLARTKSGTLTLGIDERGLWFEAPALDRSNPSVQELVSAMARGDIDQCSFAGYFLDTPRNADGVTEVREVALIDVSVVTNPWYSATEAELTGGRNLDRLALALRSLPPEERAKVWATVDVVVDTEGTEDPAEDVSVDETSDGRNGAEPDTRPTLTVEQARALFTKPAA